MWTAELQASKVGKKKKSHSQSIKYHNAGRTLRISPRHRRFYLGLWCISNICASVEGIWSSCGGRGNSRGVDQGLTLFHNSLLNLVAAPSCSGKVLQVTLKCQTVPLTVFKKGVAWQKKKKKELWDEKKLLFPETSISVLRVAAGMSRSDVSECCSREMFFTPTPLPFTCWLSHACNRLFLLTWSLHKTHICL